MKETTKNNPESTENPLTDWNRFEDTLALAQENNADAIKELRSIISKDSAAASFLQRTKDYIKQALRYFYIMEERYQNKQETIPPAENPESTENPDIAKDVECLVKTKSLKKLEKERELIQAQIEIAHEKKNIKALERLQVMLRTHDEAIFEKHFGKDNPNHGSTKNPQFRKKRKGIFLEMEGISRRGQEAVDRGLMTKKMIADEYGVTQVAVEYVMTPDEWHHATGSRGEVLEVDFYKSPEPIEADAMKLYPSRLRAHKKAKRSLIDARKQGLPDKALIDPEETARAELEELEDISAFGWQTKGNHGSTEKPESTENPKPKSFNPQIQPNLYFGKKGSATVKKAAEYVGKLRADYDIAHGTPLNMRNDIKDLGRAFADKYTGQKNLFKKDRGKFVKYFADAYQVATKPVKNPSGAAFTAAEQKRAIEIYKKFTGHEPDNLEVRELKGRTMLIRLGRADSVTYEAAKHGEPEMLYNHRFEFDADVHFDLENNAIMIIGKHLEITKRGIEG